MTVILKIRSGKAFLEAKERRFAVKNKTKEWINTRTRETHDVDVGLEPQWLESLNTFRHLILRSVCEGHLNGERQFATKSMPILRIVVDSGINAKLSRSNPPIHIQIQAIFDADPLALTTDFWHSWSDVGDKEYCLFLDAKKDRSSDEMEPWVCDWFKDAIAFLGRVDAVLTK